MSRSHFGLIDRELKIVVAAAAVIMMGKLVAAALLLGSTMAPSALIMPLAAIVATALMARLKLRRLTFACGVYAVFKLLAVGTGFWSIMAFHVGRSFSMVDQALATADARLGFDFVAYVQFMERNYIFNTILCPAYNLVAAAGHSAGASALGKGA